jgi:hypothetical protein
LFPAFASRFESRDDFGIIEIVTGTLFSEFVGNPFFLASPIRAKFVQTALSTVAKKKGAGRSLRQRLY